RRPRIRRRAARGRRSWRPGRGRPGRAWRRALSRTSEHHRLLELAPYRLERGDHLADRAVRGGAVDEGMHEVVVALRGAGQLGEPGADGRAVPVGLDLR